MKACNHCKETKPLEDYHKDRSKKDGRRGICKECWNIKKITHNKTYLKSIKKSKMQDKADKLNITILIYSILKEEKQRIKKEMKIVSQKTREFSAQIERELTIMKSHKVCSICNKNKSVTDYHNKTNGIDGKDSRCKECDKRREKNLSTEYKKRKRIKESEYLKTEIGIIKSRARTRERKLKLKAIPMSKLKQWKKKQKKVCYWCGIKCDSDFHIDHYYPLSKGGKHTIDNLVISCSGCNLRKGSKDPTMFAKSIGRLL